MLPLQAETLFQMMQNEGPKDGAFMQVDSIYLSYYLASTKIIQNIFELSSN